MNSGKIICLTLILTSLIWLASGQLNHPTRQATLAGQRSGSQQGQGPWSHQGQGQIQSKQSAAANSAVVPSPTAAKGSGPTMTTWYEQTADKQIEPIPPAWDSSWWYPEASAAINQAFLQSLVNAPSQTTNSNGSPRVLIQTETWIQPLTTAIKSSPSAAVNSHSSTGATSSTGQQHNSNTATPTASTGGHAQNKVIPLPPGEPALKSAPSTGGNAQLSVHQTLAGVGHAAIASPPQPPPGSSWYPPQEGQKQWAQAAPLPPPSPAAFVPPPPSWGQSGQGQGQAPPPPQPPLPPGPQQPQWSNQNPPSSPSNQSPPQANLQQGPPSHPPPPNSAGAGYPYNTGYAPMPYPGAQGPPPDYQSRTGQQGPPAQQNPGSPNTWPQHGNAGNAQSAQTGHQYPPTGGTGYHDPPSQWQGAHTGGGQTSQTQLQQYQNQGQNGQHQQGGGFNYQQQRNGFNTGSNQKGQGQETNPAQQQQQQQRQTQGNAFNGQYSSQQQYKSQQQQQPSWNYHQNQQQMPSWNGGGYQSQTPGGQNTYTQQQQQQQWAPNVNNPAPSPSVSIDTSATGQQYGHPPPYQQPSNQPQGQHQAQAQHRNPHQPPAWQGQGHLGNRGQAQGHVQSTWAWGQPGATTGGTGWMAVRSSRPGSMTYSVSYGPGSTFIEEFRQVAPRIQQILSRDYRRRLIASITVDRNTGTFSLRSRSGSMCYVGMIDNDILNAINEVSDRIRTSTTPTIQSLENLLVFKETEQLFVRDVVAVAGRLIARSCGHEPVIFRIVRDDIKPDIYLGNSTIPGNTCPFGDPLRNGYSLYHCGVALCPMFYTCHPRYNICCPNMSATTRCVSLSVARICAVYQMGRRIID